MSKKKIIHFDDSGSSSLKSSISNPKELDFETESEKKTSIKFRKSFKSK